MTDVPASPVGPPQAARAARALLSRWPVATFVVRRLAAGLATVLIASALVFFATEVLPGDVASAVLGRDATPDTVAQLNERLHLDQPVIGRYLHWLSGLVRGDLGDSAAALARGRTDSAIWPQISMPLANSLTLAMIAIVLMIPLAIGLGVIAATRLGRAIDHAISLTSLVIVALPEFVVGSLLVLVFFVNLGCCRRSRSCRPAPARLTGRARWCCPCSPCWAHRWREASG
jgi:peptide/nickel transport system permease protein